MKIHHTKVEFSAIIGKVFSINCAIGKEKSIEQPINKMGKD